VSWLGATTVPSLMVKSVVEALLDMVLVPEPANSTLASELPPVKLPESVCAPEEDA